MEPQAATAPAQGAVRCLQPPPLPGSSAAQHAAIAQGRGQLPIGCCSGGHQGHPAAQAGQGQGQQPTGQSGPHHRHIRSALCGAAHAQIRRVKEVITRWNSSFTFGQRTSLVLAAKV
jgi:hypothetical protein